MPKYNLDLCSVPPVFAVTSHICACIIMMLSAECIHGSRETCLQTIKKITLPEHAENKLMRAVKSSAMYTTYIIKISGVLNAAIYSYQCTKKNYISLIIGLKKICLIGITRPTLFLPPILNICVCVCV